MRQLIFVLTFVLLFGVPALANQVSNGGFEDTGTFYNPPPVWITYGANPPLLYNSGMPYGIPAFEGSKYAGDAADWSPLYKDGGLYQSVSVNLGSSGTARVMISVLNNQHPLQPNWGRIGIDPTGGVNPASSNIQWATQSVANNPNWQLVETPSVNATGAVVTVFLEMHIQSSPAQNAVFFDACTVTGTLADTAVPGDPPDPSNIVLTSPAIKAPLTFSYTLTDNEDADTGATISPEFRIGRILDQSFLPSEMYLVNTALQSLPSSPTGNGTGTGNWRIQGQAAALFRGAIDRAGTTLAYQGLGVANYPVVLDIKITDWERTAGFGDYEGAGLCLMTPNRQYYYMVGAFEDISTSALMVDANWHIASASTGEHSAYYNLEGTAVPTDGANPIYFRLERRADNTLSSGYSRNGTGYTTVWTQDVTGTALDLSQNLLFGIVVNGEVIINFESVVTPFMAATPGVGGDGTTGLASTSTGSSHTFVWNASTDLGPLSSGLNVQLQLTANDANGYGAPATSSFYELGLATSGVERWFLSR